MNKPTHHRRQTTPPPRTIEALLMQYKPLAIENEQQYHEASEWVDELAILDKRTAGQERFLETLTVLMEAYEEQHHSVSTKDITPLHSLQFLVQENGLSGRDLGRILGDESLGNRILRGERELSKAHIRKLADYFKVSPDLFF